MYDRMINDRKNKILKLIEDSGVSFCNFPVADGDNQSKEELAMYLAEHLGSMISGEIDECCEE